mmetsp:Transcript_15612/g.29382  ORF Transcript_15612/g.29382 Transcript_15612/m.29382 type:complete len:98 (-) Transcript_15612:261-554(-)
MRLLWPKSCLSPTSSINCPRVGRFLGDESSRYLFRSEAEAFLSDTSNMGHHCRSLDIINCLNDINKVWHRQQPSFNIQDNQPATLVTQIYTWRHDSV